MLLPTRDKRLAGVISLAAVIGGTPSPSKNGLRLVDTAESRNSFAGANPA
jgi:hypothetical protein